MKTNWPDEVPVLEAGDMCRDTLAAKDRHCLMGWRNAAFGREDRLYDDHEFDTYILRAARQLKAHQPTGDPVLAINDCRQNSLPRLARIWNRACALAGYTVHNPEVNQRTGKLKPV